MSRPLRLEFVGALYHVTARGDRRAAIFLDDTDRRKWLRILSLVCIRFNVLVHAYCQMDNHYHVMMETSEGNLSQVMRQLNAFYSQYFNHRHKFVGHVLQGRYKAILVQKENYLLELSRYIVLNPVRAGKVAHPKEWRWSSYNSIFSAEKPPVWLDTDWLLSQFGDERGAAVEAYREFVQHGLGRESPLIETRHQIVLGDDVFAKQHGDRLGSPDFTAVTKAQRRCAVKTLQEYEVECTSRDESMAKAYFSTAFTMAEIGRHFNVSPQTVSRAVRRFERTAYPPAE
jgi:putative transposase